MFSPLMNSRFFLGAKVLGVALILVIGVRQLLIAFPGLPAHSVVPSSPERIPEKLWQTWHTPAALLQDQEKARVRSWLEKNPGYRYELVTDKAAENFVRDQFSKDALLHDTFLGLNDTILRADFLRYLMILAEGGVYADIDVECYQGVQAWLPTKLWDTAGAIVGIESDRNPVENDVKLYSDYRSHIFAINNWTFMAKRGHPFMRLVAESVAKNLQTAAKKQNRTLSGMELSYMQVIDSTGPGAFTVAFLEYVSKVVGTEITYSDVTMLEEPKIFGDVIVLPIRAMSKTEADREDGDGARSKDWPSALYHWSFGSWKGTHFISPEPKPDVQPT